MTFGTFCLNSESVTDCVVLGSMPDSPLSRNKRTAPELDLIYPSDFFDVLGDEPFRAIADSHHTKDTCNADEDAEDGESRTGFIFLDMPDTCGNCLMAFHATPPDLCWIKNLLTDFTSQMLSSEFSLKWTQKWLVGHRMF